MTEVFDYIVVGGGAAGSVLAGQLIERKSGSVCLVEAGLAPIGPRIYRPSHYPTLFGSDWDEALTTVSQPKLRGRKLQWPRGRMLGGCTGMNALIYLRGAPDDFCSWPESWQYSKNSPAFDALERRYFDELDSDSVELHPLSEQFLQTAATIEGEKQSVDLCHANQSWVHVQPGPIRYRRTQKRGRRLTAYDVFLKPFLNDAGLRIHLNTSVEKILFEGDKAVGVQAKNASGRFSLRARKGVVLSAGAIHSPRLLMQSGIGPKNQLEKHQIRVRRSMEAVGENLQDHLIFPIVHALKEPMAIEKRFSSESRLEYVRFRTGPVASNLAEVGAFLCLSEPSDERSMKRVRSLVESNVTPEIQIHFTPNHYLEYPIRENPTPAFSIGVTLLHPKSRGAIRLCSTEKVGLSIDPNYLSDASDMELTMLAIEYASQFGERSPFSELSKQELIPGKLRSSPERLRSAIAAYSTTLFHPVGTCRIGDSNDSVVDSQLRVRGFENLYVADASVFPNLPSGNPQATVMMVGYRLADMLSCESSQSL